VQRQLRRFQSDASGRVVVEVHLLPPPLPGRGGEAGAKEGKTEAAAAVAVDAAALAALAWAARLRAACGDAGASLKPRSPTLLHALLAPSALEVSSTWPAPLCVRHSRCVAVAASVPAA
jgi:hypothetical protein